MVHATDSALLLRVPCRLNNGSATCETHLQDCPMQPIYWKKKNFISISSLQSHRLRFVEAISELTQMRRLSLSQPRDSLC